MCQSVQDGDLAADCHPWEIIKSAGLSTTGIVCALPSRAQIGIILLNLDVTNKSVGLNPGMKPMSALLTTALELE